MKIPPWGCSVFVAFPALMQVSPFYDCFCKFFIGFTVADDVFSFVAFDVDIVICAVPLEFPTVSLQKRNKILGFHVFLHGYIMRLLCAYVNGFPEKESGENLGKPEKSTCICRDFVIK